MGERGQGSRLFGHCRKERKNFFPDGFPYLSCYIFLGTESPRGAGAQRVTGTLGALFPGVTGASRCPGGKRARGGSGSSRKGTRRAR